MSESSTYCEICWGEVRDEACTLCLREDPSTITEGEIGIRRGCQLLTEGHEEAIAELEGLRKRVADLEAEVEDLRRKLGTAVGWCKDD